MNLIGAERAAGLVFREDFRSRYLAESNGCALLGDAYVDTDGLGNTATGYASVEVPSVSVGAFTVVVRFTPSGVWNTGTVRYLLDTESGNRTFRIAVDAANQLFVEVNGTTVFTVAGGVGTWSDGWVAGQETVLVCAISSGDSYVAVGGNSHTSVTTFAVSAQIRKLFLLATNAGATVLVGSVREFVLIGHRVEALDEPVLRNNTLISDIRSDQSLITLPLERDYPVSGVQSTPLEGTHKSVLSHAQLGDGSTSSTFPTRTSHKSGYSFDGGDYIEIAHHANISFTDGVDDRPFTIIAAIAKQNTLRFPILTKGVFGTNAEITFRIASDEEMEIWIVDQLAATGYLYARASAFNWENGRYIVAATYDGGGVNTGVYLYRDGVDVTNLRLTSSFSSVTSYNTPILVGYDSSLYSTGEINGVELYHHAASPMQIQVLDYRMRRKVGL